AGEPGGAPGDAADRHARPDHRDRAAPTKGVEPGEDRLPRLLRRYAAREGGEEHSPVCREGAARAARHADADQPRVAGGAGEVEFGAPPGPIIAPARDRS